MKTRTLLPAISLACLAVIAVSPAAFAETSLDQQSGPEIQTQLGVFATLSTGQSFTAGLTGDLTALELYLREIWATPTVPLRVGLYEAVGDLPSGSELTFETLDPADLALAGTPTRISFANPMSVVAGGHYAVLLTSTGGGFPNGAYAANASASQYAGGCAFQNSGAGNVCFNNDLAFATYVWHPDPVEATQAAPAALLQQIKEPVEGCSAFRAGAELNWAGVDGGGWGSSWAQWANDGAGGAVCTRTVEYSANEGRWHVQG